MIRKTAVVLMIIGSLFAVGAVTAKTYDNYDFQQEQMIIDGSDIFVLSSLDTTDHISKLNKYGDLVWQADFNSKIISWRVTRQDIYVFSKDRVSTTTTHLTRLDRFTGAPIWER